MLILKGKGAPSEGVWGLRQRVQMTQNLIREASEGGGSCGPRLSRPKMPVRRC